MIERIVIENFKSIRELDLELKPINILIGANGAGKSNLLNFFKFFYPLFGGGLQTLIGNNINSYLYFGRNVSKKLKGLIDIDNRFSIQFTIAPTFGKNTGYVEEIKILHNNSDGDEGNYEQWGTVFKRNDVDEGDLFLSDVAASDHIQEHFDFLSVYHFQDASERSSIKIPSRINDNRVLRGDGANLAAFLYFLQEKHGKEFENIERHISEVAPFFDRFDLAPDRLNSENIELRWVEKGSSDYFNAFDISDGTLRFIALTALLLQPSLPKVIVIDEPELGLHPFAINKLAAMIKNAAANGCQVIISTQSAGLLDNFEPEDIVAVDRDEEQSTFRRLKSEELDEWLEDYTIGDLWNKNVIGARP